METLQFGTVENSEFVEGTFDFWFNPQEDHIRSPFPEYIRPQLKILSTEKFFLWSNNLNPKAKDEVNDEIIAEKFEELIFETAIELVRTEDEKITINYPFLPRIGDQIYDNNNEESIVIDRNIAKTGDTSFLEVKLRTLDTEIVWETQFELPL